MARYTVEFVNVYLKRDAEAMEFLGVRHGHHVPPHLMWRVSNQQRVDRSRQYAIHKLKSLNSDQTRYVLAGRMGPLPERRGSR